MLCSAVIGSSVSELPNNGASVFGVVGPTFLQLHLMTKYMAKFARLFGQCTLNFFIFPFSPSLFSSRANKTAFLCLKLCSAV